jgi:hypothetical protein
MDARCPICGKSEFISKIDESYLGCSSCKSEWFVKDNREFIRRVGSTYKSFSTKLRESQPNLLNFISSHQALKVYKNSLLYNGGSFR